MKDLLLQPTALAQWYALVNDAEMHCALELGEDLESYLVFLLMRFTEKPELSKTIIALEFLESLQKIGGERQIGLQEIGDKCLIYSGLFPEHVKRRRVRESYYIDLGQNAYYMLATISRFKAAHLYENLCKGFLMMRDVLLTIKQEDNAINSLQRLAEQEKSVMYGKPRTRH